MGRNPLKEAHAMALAQGRLLMAPLVGLPGLNLVGSTIKLAQQNYGIHFQVVRALADRLQPDLLFPLMDLSVEANALGWYTVFPKDDSATVVKDAFHLQELDRLAEINISFDTRLIGYVETVKLMSLGLSSGIMRGAYVTGPYTLTGLLMGAEEAAMATVMRPEELDKICRFTTERILQYVRMLIAAGAQLICVLEPTSVMLRPEQFERFSARYVSQISNFCHYSGVSVVYHVCGNTTHLVEKMAASGVDALSLDSAATGLDFPAVARRIPKDILLIGNINPTGAILHGKPEQVCREVQELLESMAPFENFILSTGCDLPQETPIENIEAFMETGRAYRRK